MNDVSEQATDTAPAASADTVSAIPAEELERMTDDIIGALKSVYDPEIPVDIYELGLIYRIDVDDDRNVAIDMTLTAPGCPVAGEMPIWVESAVSALSGIGDVRVQMVFDPPWDPSRMSDEARGRARFLLTYIRSGRESERNGPNVTDRAHDDCDTRETQAEGGDAHRCGSRPRSRHHGEFGPTHHWSSGRCQERRLRRHVLHDGICRGEPRPTTRSSKTRASPG